ncbi:alpha-hydroxy-acid oxidizing protein, partial [Streptomyces sp. NPDC004561]
PEVGQVRRETLGFPAWALVNDPANGHHALALAPVGVLSIMHPDAETAAARAAAAQGVPYILSSASSTPMEQVAEAMGDAERWFQLYWGKDREVTRSFLGRAKAAGFSVLVVTLDTPLLAWRPRDLDQAYLPFLHGVGTANYFSDPAFRAGLAKPPHEDPNAAVLHFLGLFGDPGHTWPDLAFLREHWDGPIVLKGVLHPDDARLAADAGMDGVVVSNHGGRQVAGSVAAADALPGVAAAVGDRLTVLFDSGVRTGDDVFKALALGARAVLLGRPYVYGLGLDGQAGVEHVVRCVLAELDLTLALSGHTGPATVTAADLVEEPA